MNIIDDIKPISFLKQKTSEIVNRVKTTKQPTFITINGNVELVIQDAESYQEMVNSMYSLSENDISKIKAGLKEVEEGKGISADEFFEKIKNKYGIQFMKYKVIILPNFEIDVDYIVRFYCEKNVSYVP